MFQKNNDLNQLSKPFTSQKNTPPSRQERDAATKIRDEKRSKKENSTWKSEGGKN